LHIPLPSLFFFFPSLLLILCFLTLPFFLCTLYLTFNKNVIFHN
jgi:hypothetical protein